MRASQRCSFDGSGRAVFSLPETIVSALDTERICLFFIPTSPRFCLLIAAVCRSTTVTATFLDYLFPLLSVSFLDAGSRLTATRYSDGAQWLGAGQGPTTHCRCAPDQPPHTPLLLAGNSKNRRIGLHFPGAEKEGNI